MSDIEHPHIDPALQTVEEMPLAAEFAENAYEILASYKYTRTEVINSVATTQRLTGRADIISEDPTALTALRLKSVLTSAFSAEVQLSYATTEPSGFVRASEDNSEDYLVIALEHGVMPSEDIDEDLDTNELEDDDFTWQAYALSVTNVHTGEATVLDGRTGKLFSDGDIFRAMYALDLLRKELRTTDYESALFEDNTFITARRERHTQPTAYEPFDEAEVIATNYEQHRCAADCSLANERHQQSFQN